MSRCERTRAMSTVWRGALVAASLMVLTACQTTGSAARGVEVEGPRPASGGGGKPGSAAPTEQLPQVSSRAKMLFDDAVKAADAQGKAKSPDWPAVERKFQAAVEADSNLAEADYNLGVLAERQGRTKEAVDHYRTALRKRPTLKQAAENLAVIAQNSGDEAGAVQIYQNIVETYPDDGSSRARLAEIYRRRGDLDKALELSREALYREPRTLTAYKVMMQVHYEQKQLSLARLVALRASKIDDRDPEIYYTLGLLDLAEKEPAKARLNFKKAIDVRPDYLPAHLKLARMSLDQEDYGGAEISIRRILQHNGNNAEAHVDLGVAYKGMGQFDKAMAEYDAAQKLNPNLPAIYLNRGIIVGYVKNDPDKALEYYKQYIQMAGGGAGLAADHPVFEHIKQAEGVIQKREEEKKALEEAKKLEEEAKAQAARDEADKKKVADEELRKKMQEAKGKTAEEAAKGVDTGETDYTRCMDKAKTDKDRLGCEKLHSPGKTEAAPKAEPKKADPPPAAPPPAKKEEKKKSAETDEPGDDL